MNLFNLFVGRYRIYFLISIGALYAFLAYKSSGFHHPDEHFQIIEFAAYKMGETKASELAWEFAAEIRPTLQPTLCLLVFKTLRSIYIDDPYVMAFVIRLISSLFAVYVLYLYTSVQSAKFRPEFQGLFVFLSFFLWVVPYISVRFSSETWSGLFFLLSIIQLQHMYRYRFLSIGLLLGVAVLLRYQTGIMVVGLMAWLLLIEKVGFRNFLELSLGILLSMMIGFGIDMWFYEKATFTAYNYFWVNIVEDVASNFGVSPWYAYLLYILKQLGSPIGFLLLLSLLYMIVYRPREKEIWIIVPFIFIHSLIPHKEPRFLFPIAFFSGFILTSFIQYVYDLRVRKIRGLLVVYLVLFLISNALGLFVVYSKSAGNGKIAIFEYINRTYKGQRINIIYLNNLDDYMDWLLKNNTFYRDEQIQLKRAVTIWQDNFNDVIEPDVANLLLLNANDITGSRALRKMEDLGFRPAFQSIPIVSQLLINLYNPKNNDNTYLYEWQGSHQ